jgi:hypothetical protein
MSGKNMNNDLSLRHQEIIRLAFSGMPVNQIAAQVGMRYNVVATIIRSELAQAELARLTARAEDSLTNVPMKVRLINELTTAAADALHVNHGLLRDERIDPRVRANIGRHFLDRIVFGHQEDSQEGGYREILRSLDRLERRTDPTTIVVTNGAAASPEGRSPDAARVSEGADASDRTS